MADADTAYFQYRCSNGHDIGADHEIVQCPITPNGEPCDGVLVRHGWGSRTDKEKQTT